ncbi:MAG: pilus assembly protein PilM [Desulfobacterales bacterium]|nr:pilus assembly protein PilM [Desulfobacterales bacterium]
MSKLILGLDIRDNAVAAVLLKCGIKGNSIEAHTYISIADSKEIGSGISQALKLIQEKKEITGSVCIASLPSNRVAYRNISLPFKEPNKIRQVLPFELEPTLPLSIDELIIDFQIVQSAEQTDIIAAAIEKSDLGSYLEILKSFNIDPEIVTISGYLTANCLAKLSNPPQKSVIIDTDNKRSTLFILEGGQLCLIRCLPFNLDAVDRTESLWSNMDRTLIAFEEIFHLDFKPDGVFLTGYGLEHYNFEGDLAQRLKIPIKRIDLMHDTRIRFMNDPEPSWKPEQMDNALALALSEVEKMNCFNFRRGSFAAKKHWAEQKNILIKTGILAGSILALAFLNIKLDSYFIEKQVARLNSRISHIFKTAFPEVTKIVDPLQQMRVKVQEADKYSVLPGESKKNIPVIDILNNISKLIPYEIDVELTRLVIAPESIMISGDTDTFNSVDDIKNRLEKENIFETVTISSANIDRTENRVRFQLKVQL